jgi:hypothetical protein
MLVSKQVESAIAFRDRETAREVFEAISQDPTVEAVVLYTSDGRTLEARGSLTAPGGGFVAHLPEQRITAANDYVLVMAPVVSLEGPRGVLALQLSTEALDRSRMDVVRAAALAGGAALVMGILAASSRGPFERRSWNARRGLQRDGRPAQRADRPDTR